MRTFGTCDSTRCTRCRMLSFSVHHSRRVPGHSDRRASRPVPLCFPVSKPWRVSPWYFPTDLTHAIQIFTSCSCKKSNSRWHIPYLLSNKLTENQANRPSCLPVRSSKEFFPMVNPLFSKNILETPKIFDLSNSFIKPKSEVRTTCREVVDHFFLGTLFFMSFMIFSNKFKDWAGD